MMEEQGKMVLSRRSFIRSSALVSGGILLGVNFLGSCKEEAAPPVDVANLDFKDFNAFIKIAENGYVTIYSPNPEIGQGVKTSMPMIIAEELDVPWDHVTVTQGSLDTDNFQRQVAGGSQSIRFGWDPLRQTGAIAKQMLINAAAVRWGVEVSSCTASEGIITNAKGESLGYGEVVNEAALLPVPENAVLKETKDYKIIGTDATNVDIHKIVTGAPLYGLDYVVPGMKYASVLRPPAFGQNIESYDDTATRAVDGVVDVVKFGNKIAVVANNTWSAMKGKKSLEVIWGDTALESSEDHDAKLDAILNGNNVEVRREDGNVQKAFAEADTIIERTYESPFLPHNCMEPMNFYADVTAEKIHLVGPIQTPAGTARRIANLLDRDVKEITLEMTRMGGGFGRRLYGDFVEEAAQISNLAKKPVKVVFSREDDMGAGVYRPAIKYRIKAALKDGEVTGYHLKEASINSNMYGLIPNFFPAGAIKNYKVESGNYQSNITTGAWRAPYTNFLAFAEQSFFDEIAKELAVDPVQLRVDLLDNVKEGEDERIQYSASRMKETIKLAADKGNWGNAPTHVHQGFAAYYSHNTHVAEVVEITMNDDGLPKVEKVTVAVDCGIVVNPTGAKNQIEGGVIDGIGHAMYGDFSFAKGRPTALNFDAYRLIRMNETPQVETYFVENNLSPTGLGEPGLPPAGGALSNAIAAATGKRILKQPFIDNMNIESEEIKG